MNPFKLYFTTLIIALIISNIACTKLPDSCAQFDNWEIISDEERSDFCEYNKIYLYNDDYYFVCECCVCNKIDMAFNCNGEALCEFSEDCMIDFYENAEYLYSAVEK